ncbi:VOC family protein [Nocardioides sp.]|uniref:VOC family protein n=1 Tax=Nocardioides sp. TaxID=35761 RepID=UPI002636AABE|nr:VOC family protein [Nocardioides sp.]MCW2735428.1 hypothetical protein [Nocardioides sp.]
MASTLHALTILALDPEELATFWSGLLRSSRQGLVLSDVDAPVRLAFQTADEPKVGLNQIHLHLTSNSAAQDATVARALELGATHLDVGQLPEEDHVVLADPGGNEFCVIPEGNNWLEGTGFLGELAADGTREVGVFWAAALDWPLVHDEDGETAISPPDGGLKISWGGEPLNERHGRNRMYFVLVADELDAEVERLAALGASLVERSGGEVEMADPEGNEFVVRARALVSTRSLRSLLNQRSRSLLNRRRGGSEPAADSAPAGVVRPGRRVDAGKDAAMSGAGGGAPGEG